VLLKYILLSVVGNTVQISNIVTALERLLATKLPPGWRISAEKSAHREASWGRAKDAILKIRAPHGKTGTIRVEAKDRLEPRDVNLLASKSEFKAQGSVLIATPYLSPRTQERLTARGIGYADLTGNIRLVLPDPGLFILTSGATENPFANPRARKSLRGPKAGRLVRAICDFRPPVGVRELAKRAGIDAGYASRLIDFLDREALVVRDQRGSITRSDWEALIRRWAQTYSPLDRSRVAWYLSPRGVTSALERIKDVSTRYAISGSWAAAQFAPVSPTRLMLCYSDDIENLARTLDLRPTDTGANVVLASPFDPVVYERTLIKNGILITAPTQIAADLLSTPGRGPNEADALMDWMKENENVWRH